MTSIDRILFGDNQFFGVNHMSEEKARSQQMRFRDTESIIDVLDKAYARGIRSFMCTTHDEIGKIADHVAANPTKYEGFKFLPGMPYAHKYNNMVGELGVIDTIKTVAPGGVMEAMVRGAKSAVGRDVGQLMRMLVDAEMARFEDVDTPVVFLQNVVTDLLLGLGNYEIFADFVQYVNEKYEAEAGFFSMNMPMMVDALETVDITNPIIACNYNKIGFRMSGGVEAYDRKLKEKPVRCIAMSVLASGAIPPAEALEWVCERPLIESIVFGASSDANIASTVNLITGFDTARVSAA